jgi:pimeloyl-ACP methyl ester carboxylesterase
MWQPQLDRVPDGWRFIAPDLRGFGGGTREADASLDPEADASLDPEADASLDPEADASLDPEADASLDMDDYAGDVLGFMDALRIETAVIGGLSMGGYITFAVFRHAPDRFAGVILADTKAQADTADGRAGRREMSEVVRTKGVSAMVDGLLPKLVGETTRRDRPQVLADARRLMEANQPGAIDAALHALMTRPDSTPDLVRIKCPALVIVGQEDTVTPAADAEILAGSIPGTELVVLPRVGHLSNLEAPDDFSGVVTRFLARAF